MHGLITLAGGVALLVWGLYMVKSGILRTFGDSLRTWLSVRLTNRAKGFAAGFGLATLLQSSTASALLVAGLQQKGLVTTATALACVLGADLGSAFVVRLLSFDLSIAVPFLTILGVIPFVRRPDTRAGQFGRVLLGLAFVMMALKTIVAATEPVKESEALLAALQTIGAHPLLSGLLGAALAFVCFSSLAVVAVATGAVTSGVIDPYAGLWVVAGANLGSALLASVSTATGSPVARRAPTGNLVFRAAGVTIAGLVLYVFAEPLKGFVDSGAKLVDFHLLLNAAIGAAGLCVLGPVARLTDRLLPSDAAPELPAEVKLETPENLLAPVTALSAARSEVVITAERLLKFWRGLDTPLRTNPPAGILFAFHDDIDLLRRRCAAVEQFLNDLIKSVLTGEEARFWQNIHTANEGLSFALDVADEIVTELETKKCAEHCFFTPEGLEELLREHRRAAEGLEMLVRLLAGERPGAQADTPKRTAFRRRALLARIRRNDATIYELTARHMKRVAEGRAGAVDTSALHVGLLALFRRFETATAMSAGEL